MNDQPVLFEVPITGKKVSRRKSPALPRIKVDHELAKDRYYYHRRLKGVFPIDAAKRIIDVAPYTSLDDIPVKQRKYITQLIDLGYNVQLMIPCPKVLKPKKKRPARRKIRTTPAGR